MPTRKHFVTFLSPGTFMSEQTTKPIDAWDSVQAVVMSEKIVERHGAKPYGFYFTTCLVTGPVPDGEGGTLNVESKEVERSGMHHLGGKVESYDEVDPKEEVLRRNMDWNDYAYVCTTTNSYRHTAIFDEKDVVVDATGQVTERGNSPERIVYRKAREEKNAWERKKLEEELTERRSGTLERGASRGDQRAEHPMERVPELAKRDDRWEALVLPDAGVVLARKHEVYDRFDMRTLRWERASPTQWAHARWQFPWVPLVEGTRDALEAQVAESWAKA